MAKRLRVKNKKRNKDILEAFKKNGAPKRHKIKAQRSTKALFKNNSKMA